MNRSMPAARCEQCGTISPLECASFCHACGQALRRAAPAGAGPRRGNLYLVTTPAADAAADLPPALPAIRWAIAGLCTLLGAAGIGALVRLSAAQLGKPGAADTGWVIGMLLVAALVVLVTTLVLLPRHAS